jgi:HK97 family phage portal protein
VITTLRGGKQVELFSFALTDMLRYGYNNLRNVSFAVSEGDVRGLPAINRAARLRSEAVATLRLCCWRGERPDQERITNVWQSRLFERPAYNEYQTRFGFWETVEESLSYRNVASIWKNTDPNTNRVLELYALHPDQVACKGYGQYEVKVMDGYIDPVGRGKGTYKVDDTTLLRIRGHGDGGMLDPKTPFQVFREALLGPIGRQRHENRVWRRGTALQVAIEFEKGITPQQAEEWKDSWKANYEGTEGETTAVIGGGGTIKPIGMTLTDAMFVEMAKLTVHDASRIMGVPANLLGAQLERGVPNLEQDITTWFRFGLGPELERIESALNADEELFGRNVPNASSVYPAFDTTQFVRGDLLTEANILQQRVQSGIITPDEARHELGYPPHPAGVGAIPQITPVGGAPNPTPVPAGSQNGSGDY